VVVDELELGVGSESAARHIDGMEFVLQELGRLIGRVRHRHDDRGRRANGPERPRRESGRLGGGRHREVPPEVTEGVEPLMEGVVAAPVLPVEPVLDESELEDEDDPVEPPDDPEPEEPAPLEVLLAPGCSWATTMPMTAAAPVAARTMARVARRSHCCARSRLCGLGGVGRDMSDRDLVARSAPHPSTPTSTLSQGRLWACCDILIRLAPSKNGAPRYDHGARLR
jgi:hypothetical protein